MGRNDRPNFLGMRKSFVIVALFCTVLFGCGKDEAPEVPPRNVSFNVTGFTQELSPIPVSKAKLAVVRKMESPATNDLSTYIGTLKFLLFDAQGKLVLQRTQASDGAAFGTFSERIKDGKYTAYFVGGPGDASTDLAAFSISNLVHDKDTFVKQVDFSVDQTDKVVDVTLDRFGAKLKIQLTDAFPADITSLKLHVKLLNKLNFATKAAESTQPEEGLVYEFDPTIRTKDASLSLFCGLFPGASYKVTGVLKAYDKDNKVVYNREIKDITLENNKLTTVTGNAFFDYTEGFTIKINADYSGNIDQKF